MRTAIPQIKISLCLCSLLLLFLAQTVCAKIHLPPCFSDHMVLQRDIPVPVWGTAGAGDEITVEFRGQKKTATADASGKWMVKLDPMNASSEPAELNVRSENAVEDSKRISDVLIGEVWIGSGQSNMGLTIGSSAPRDEALGKLAALTYPRIRFLNTKQDGWKSATPEQLGTMSALLFAFGVSLQRELDIPIGLIMSAVGSTASGYWLSNDAYRKDPACRQAVNDFTPSYPFEELQKQYREKIEAWTKASAAAQSENRRPPKKPPAPGRPGETAGGTIGHLFETRMRPVIPFGIRGVLWDQGESGTGIVGVDQYTLMGALISGWREEWKQGDFPFLYIQKPSGGGPAWDEKTPATRNAEKFVTLQPATPVPRNGEYREMHIKIMNYPNTFMVTSSDLGSGTHPTNKSGYGERAALVALGAVYGKKLEYYGPLYDSCEIASGKIRIRFAHTGQGLAFRHGETLQGFLVAGEDRKFVWADAAIDGDTVVVSSRSVPHPVAVRYAWANTAPWANLFNKDGLPAQAFRTDQWKEEPSLKTE